MLQFAEATKIPLSILRQLTVSCQSELTPGIGLKCACPCSVSLFKISSSFIFNTHSLTVVAMYILYIIYYVMPMMRSIFITSPRFVRISNGFRLW